MAYEKMNWKDRIVERPNTFRTQNNPDGTVTLIPEPGTIIQAGTPLSADTFNQMQNNIEEEFNNVNSQLAGMVKKAGDTITGTLILNNAISIQGKDTNGNVFGLLSLNDSNEVSVGSKWKKAKILNNGFVSSDGTNEWNVWTDKNAPIQENFISPTLVNGWYNKTPNFRKIEYFKDKFGLVHISGGAIGGGTSGSIMFTLPVGYRPSAPIRIVTCNTSSTFGFIEIGSDGTVKHIVGTINDIYIPPITFRAE